MKPFRWLGIFLPLACSSCISQFSDAGASRSFYVPPPKSDAPPATIQGELIPGGFWLGDPRRVLIDAIDAQDIPDETLTPPRLNILPGHHLIDTICQYGYARGRVYISLNLEAKAGHNYMVHCAPKSMLINAGTKFWITDEADGSTVVTANGWGPTQNGRLVGPAFIPGEY